LWGWQCLPLPPSGSLGTLNYAGEISVTPSSSDLGTGTGDGRTPSTPMGGMRWGFPVRSGARVAGDLVPTCSHKGGLQGMLDPACDDSPQPCMRGAGVPQGGARQQPRGGVWRRHRSPIAGNGGRGGDGSGWVEASQVGDSWDCWGSGGKLNRRDRVRFI
jgi:hypothetical protein